MSPTTQHNAEELFRACADRTRLRLLKILREGELCVCHLVDIVGLPQPTVSRHLAALRRAGLVQVRKEGLWSHYSLVKSRSGLHAALLECLECCSDELPELALDSSRSRKIRKTIACCEGKTKP